MDPWVIIMLWNERQPYRVPYVWSKYECFLISGCQETLMQRDRKGKGNVYDRGDCNSSLHKVQSRDKNCKNRSIDCGIYNSQTCDKHISFAAKKKGFF